MCPDFRARTQRNVNIQCCQSPLTRFGGTDPHMDLVSLQGAKSQIPEIPLEGENLEGLSTYPADSAYLFALILSAAERLFVN